MKPLIILRYPSNLNQDELIDMSQYIKNHPASEDYHFFIVADPEWNGPIDFQYFNGDSYQYNIN